MSNRIVSQSTSPSFRFLPPPVRPGDQETEFAMGDALLADFGAGEQTVAIGDARVCRYEVRPGLVIRETLYSLRFYSPDGKQLRNSLCGVSEARLRSAFRGWIWWLS